MNVDRTIERFMLSFVMFALFGGIGLYLLVEGLKAINVDLAVVGTLLLVAAILCLVGAAVEHHHRPSDVYEELDTHHVRLTLEPLTRPEADVMLTRLACRNPKRKFFVRDAN